MSLDREEGFGAMHGAQEMSTVTEASSESHDMSGYQEMVRELAQSPESMEVAKAVGLIKGESDPAWAKYHERMKREAHKDA